jgi:hypothetical protein
MSTNKIEFSRRQYCHATEIGDYNGAPSECSPSFSGNADVCY